MAPPYIPAHAPADLDLIVARAIEEGDIDLAVALYEPGAAMVLATGEITTSSEKIRDEFLATIALKPKVVIEEHVVCSHADGTLATTRVRGHMLGTDADRNPVRLDFHTLGVARKQSDGTWRFAIDDPQGSAKTTVG